MNPKHSTSSSSESNHNLKATLAFIRLDLFIGEAQRRGGRQIEGAAARIITKHPRQTSHGSVWLLICLHKPRSSPASPLKLHFDWSSRHLRSSCHLVCIQSEGVWCIMTTGRGSPWKSKYIQTHTDRENLRPQL